MAFLSDPWYVYFIPALINCSLQELNAKKKLDDTSIAVSNAIDRLDSFTYAGQESVRLMREMFSLEQVEIIQDWVYTLAACDIELPGLAEHYVDFISSYISEMKR